MDIDVDVEVDVHSLFWLFTGAFKSVQVLLNGIEAVMVVISMFLK